MTTPYPATHKSCSPFKTGTLPIIAARTSALCMSSADLHSSRRADPRLEWILKARYRSWVCGGENKVFIVMSYDSVFCLINVQASVVYFANAPSQLFWEGKLGKPKEEIRNLNGFEYMYLSDLKIPYFFCTSPPYPYKLFKWARHSSPPWQDLLCQRLTNRNWTQKDSTYNSLEYEVEKKGSEVKSENLDTIHAENCLHRGIQLPLREWELIPKYWENICPFVCPSICPSFHLYICLFVCPHGITLGCV